MNIGKSNAIDSRSIEGKVRRHVVITIFKDTKLLFHKGE